MWASKGDTQLDLETHLVAEVDEAAAEQLLGVVDRKVRAGAHLCARTQFSAFSFALWSVRKSLRISGHRVITASSHRQSQTPGANPFYDTNKKYCIDSMEKD